MSRLLKRIVQALAAAAYPGRCVRCGRLLRSVPQGSKEGQALTFAALMARYVCRTCLTTYTPVTPPLCNRCGTLFRSREGASHLCGACMRKPRAYTIARAVGIYDRVLMDVVHHFKYRGKIHLARPLGRRLFAEFTRHWGQQAVDLVVPVPLHRARFRRRGFNQAYLLVREWRHLAEAANPQPLDFRIDPHILVRHRRTAPQSGLGPKQRRANLRKALTVAAPKRVQGRHVLIVDDVYTTGATADECARTLLGNGAKRVDILTLARVM
jgi:ComF family protein